MPRKRISIARVKRIRDTTANPKIAELCDHVLHYQRSRIPLARDVAERRDAALVRLSELDDEGAI